jgi:hypothetical protein
MKESAGNTGWESSAAVRGMEVKDACFDAALKLHDFLMKEYWNGHGLLGPDPGVRFNWRIGRFITNYFPILNLHDSLYYLQAQGYFVLANWRLFQLTGSARYCDVALRCSDLMLERQRKDGAWDYPNPEWKGRAATAEGTWAALGLLESYRETGETRYLAGILRWHEFLIESVGFEQIGEELSVNYFANRRRARIPNNSAFMLRFLAELVDVTGDNKYLEPCRGMIVFMRNAQKPNGEFPYMVKAADPGGRCWEHFQCYQYNAFQCLDLMRYYQLRDDPTLRPILDRSLSFLSGGLAKDGHPLYDCINSYRQITYHAAVLGAAFYTASELGLADDKATGDRAFEYVLSRQQENGAFPFSSGDYRVLQDSRSYPRPLSFILYHCLTATKNRRNPSGERY